MHRLTGKTRVKRIYSEKRQVDKNIEIERIDTFNVYLGRS